MSTLFRFLAFIVTVLVAVILTVYAVLVVWDRTHRPELPAEMRAEVWNGGANVPTRSRHRPYSNPSTRLK